MATIENTLPRVDGAIAGLRVGQVERNPLGDEQVYFGNDSVERLRPYDTVTLRDGRITVAMYTIEGRTDVDYAQITIKTPLTDRTATERGKALRFGGTRPADLLERTPIQFFLSTRGFMDIPLSGRARWLAVNPEGDFTEGLFDDRLSGHANQVARFGEGWTWVWIVEGSRPFTFGELCSPRFIDQTDLCPSGEAGIEEIEPSGLQRLPQIFQDRYAFYMSGEHLRSKAA